MKLKLGDIFYFTNPVEYVYSKRLYLDKISRTRIEPNVKFIVTKIFSIESLTEPGATNFIEAVRYSDTTRIIRFSTSEFHSDYIDDNLIEVFKKAGSTEMQMLIRYDDEAIVVRIDS